MNENLEYILKEALNITKLLPETMRNNELIEEEVRKLQK
jgi:hypothetical protein